ncbi:MULTISPECIES: winged helix-turn-helix domain-containing protein [unclassified Pseudomonas]|uniref:winged helix-turn-helix domain-containing protein n=1 Tax=unclassified Pseudomonas TaxID=196821 RepID=UPI0024477498|nr:MULTISPECIES: winged helix-turn-helix domain-containing protein [unclassified Pseudomonas]MDH0301781.1 winged helix-turn-helix domain-containing protein [Pseudomonas sp. GD04091]MDH1983931.1 winged helix-turn-helix domain-containing protein [Pseudomonas sp. GD03689]
MSFEFDDYVLDEQRRELTRRGQAVAIGPQVFDLLLQLVVNRDRVMGRDELLANVWNGRIVSESTIASHINAVRKAIGDSGEEQRLLRTVARKGYRFVGQILEAPPVEQPAPRPVEPGQALALPDKPSITVLPFQNLSGDPEQDYFADGIVEDIIAALSRFRWLFVIARNSSFTFKGQRIDVHQIGQTLGVRYVLEGSVRKAGNRIRITGQLIDASSGEHLWAERFEGLLDDLFELQDQVAESVVGAIAPQLERAEIERAKRKPTDSLCAYDYYLRGTAKMHTGTREAIAQALSLFHQAVELDPEFASAYGMAAWCYFWRKVNGWMDDRPAEIAEGARLAHLAVALGRDDAVALTRGGHALGHLAGDLDGAIAMLDRARLLNPNLAPAWYLGGILRALRGETQAAIDNLNHATRLSPLDPEMFRMQVGMALAHFFAGRLDNALEWAEKALGNLPTLLPAVALVAACHALNGRFDSARQAMARLRAQDPALQVSTLRQWLPIYRDEDLARLAEGLRQAGLPE